MTAPVPDQAGPPDAQQAVAPQPQIPAAPPEQDGVDMGKLGKAIDNGSNLAASAQSAEDYLRFAQGVKALSDALLELEGNPGGAPQKPPPAGNG